MERKKYDAFVRVNNLSPRDFNAKIEKNIESAVNEILDGEVAYTFPQDSTIPFETEDIPVVVELILFAFKFGPKSYDDKSLVRELTTKIEIVIESILATIHERQTIVIPQIVARSEVAM